MENNFHKIVLFMLLVSFFLIRLLEAGLYYWYGYILNLKLFGVYPFFFHRLTNKLNIFLSILSFDILQKALLCQQTDNGEYTVLLCFLSTGGSGDTDSQEQIMENLKLHKEVLWGVKQQPWGMRKKLKLVRQAKTYVKRHEGQLQQRRATRDFLARFNLFLLKVSLSSSSLPTGGTAMP